MTQKSSSRLKTVFFKAPSLDAVEDYIQENIPPSSFDKVPEDEIWDFQKKRGNLILFHNKIFATIIATRAIDVVDIEL